MKREEEEGERRTEVVMVGDYPRWKRREAIDGQSNIESQLIRINYVRSFSTSIV